MILDVEKENVIYKEMVWDGTQAFMQYQEADKVQNKKTTQKKGRKR